jgi:TolA-binding protein
MLNAELGKWKGFDHRPDTLVLVERHCVRSRATKLLLRFKTTAATETKTRIAKRRNTMDDYNNPLSETPGGQPERGAATAARMKLSEKAAEVKERVADFGRKTADNIDESRKSTAGALDQTAAKLHSSGDRLSGAAHTAADQISGAAHGTADKLRAAADYIRETDLKGMGEDLKDIVKRYPGPALAAAAVLGFIVARGFRRD